MTKPTDCALHDGGDVDALCECETYAEQLARVRRMALDVDGDLGLSVFDQAALTAVCDRAGPDKGDADA